MVVVLDQMIFLQKQPLLIFLQGLQETEEWKYRQTKTVGQTFTQSRNTANQALNNWPVHMQQKMNNLFWPDEN